MVGKKTFFYIADNSGGQFAECIKVLKSRLQKISIGKFIIVVIKKTRLKKKIKLKKHNLEWEILIQ